MSDSEYGVGFGGAMALDFSSMQPRLDACHGDSGVACHESQDENLEINFQVRIWIGPHIWGALNMERANPYEPDSSVACTQATRRMDFRIWAKHVLWFCPILIVPFKVWILFELTRAEEDPGGRLGSLLSTSEIQFVWTLIGLLVAGWIAYLVWWLKTIRRRSAEVGTYVG